MTNRYICRRCGLPVRLWVRPRQGGTYWKHSGGFRARPSCGQRPDVVERPA